MDLSLHQSELEHIPELSKVRSVESFVEDMVSDGRTEKQVLTVANNTHWRHQMDKVKTALTALYQRFPKKSKKKRKNSKKNS